MAQIVLKPFKAEQKIIRSEFKGVPNLITTSDLNRQIEALKYEADSLSDLSCFGGGLVMQYELLESTLRVYVDYFSIEFKGCKFFPPDGIYLNINLTSSAPKAYLCLVAEKETVTYDTDFSHSIAGAKFVDGTSMPAANQIIYKNEEIVLTHALSSLDNLVGIIAVIELSDSGELKVYKNYLDKHNEESILLHLRREIEKIKDALAETKGDNP